MPFAAIIGHHAVIDLLRHAVARGRVPQSLLLAGPDGVGKHTTAVALAQAVNCPVRRQSGADDACGTCPTCRRIAAGTHSDVVELDRGDEASIKIKALRDRLLEVVGYRPFEAERRIFIIDPADDLTIEAQDALLKTLEEPPPSAILMLISAYPDTLRPTVLSRCRRVRFGPLAEQDVARVLIERHQLDPARARLLAAISGGSPARALAADDDDLTADRDAALSLLQAAARQSVMGRLKASAALAKHGTDRRDRESLGLRLSVVESLLRDLVALAARPAAVVNTDLARELQALQSSFDPSRAARGFDTIIEGQAALDRNASPKLVADWVAVRL
jgi:DNA polymerase-3 subunit delta'